MTSAFIHVVMRGTWDPKQCCTKDEHPVEAHHIQMVAESRAKSLGDMRSNAGFVFSVKMTTLYGSKAVAVFPGVNARIAVEEPGKTPRRTRRLPQETVECVGTCLQSMRSGTPCTAGNCKRAQIIKESGYEPL